MSQYDTASLYGFLLHTPEQGLRKMLVDNKSFSDAHFNLMLKIIRSCNEEQFGNHFDKKDYPKIKMGPAEIKLKEKFWSDAETTFLARGLLNKAQSAA